MRTGPDSAKPKTVGRFDLRRWGQPTSPGFHLRSGTHVPPGYPPKGARTWAAGPAPQLNPAVPIDQTSRPTRDMAANRPWLGHLPIGRSI
jgi:hypothetical protein